MKRYEVTPIGTVESPLTSLASAPKQADEGAPSAWLAIDAAFAAALDGIEPGDAIVVLTWLHQARRDVLARPSERGSQQNRTGSVRDPLPRPPEPDRSPRRRRRRRGRTPRRRRRSRAIDGTPVVDIKPNLAAPGAR